MARSVEYPTLDFDSRRDPKVVGLSPVLGSTLNVEAAWHSLSLSLCPSPPLVLSLSLKHKKKFQKNTLIKNDTIK